MVATYNTLLVLLSIGMAFLASYTAIHLALRMTSANGYARMLWHMGGSFSMGTGIWGMHFIGMLALELPVSVSYDLFLTFISWLLAVVASIIVLSVISRNHPGWLVWISCAVMMGIGITGMHYVGMFAMQIQPAIQYDFRLLLLSFAIAILISLAAIFIIHMIGLYNDQEKIGKTLLWTKISAALAMAIAISGMHYTGMSAAIFPEEFISTDLDGLGGDRLGMLVTLAVVMVLLTALYAAIFDARFAEQNTKMVEKLKQLNIDLMAHAEQLTQAMAEKAKALEAVNFVHKELMRAKEVAERNAAELLSYQNGIDQYALVSVTDRQGRIIQINDKFVSISQYSRDELLGQDHRILNSGTHPKDFFVNLWRTITRGETWRGEICNQAKDGSLYWIDTAIIPLKNDQGEIIRFISVRVDITQRKQHESELLTARQAADAANQAKSRFLANMSHEIRTPMNSIIGMTHLLDQTALDSKQIDYVAKIKNSSQHLLRIINEILDFSKIEAGKIEVAVKDLDLNKILSDVLDHLTSDLGDKNIELVSDVAPGLSQNFQGDALRLSQVLLNLISNAIKFTEAGKITVSACIEQESNIDCLVRFEIHDTGIGIAKEKIDHIFQPFDQVDTSITRKYGGTGLGLAISKELVGLMGGTIGVESQTGKGSHFWFTARLSRNLNEITYPSEVTHTPQNELRSLAGLTLLVVEDNELNQQVAKELLELYGAEVVIARHGKEALDQLRRTPFNGVLMDIQMPVMDGLEATKIIRSNPEWSDLVIIAMTANVDQNDRELCLSVGMNDFLAKPINPDMLLSTLLKWLSPVSGSIQPIVTATTNKLLSGSDTDSPIDLSVMTGALGVDSTQVTRFIRLFLETTHEGIEEIEEACRRADRVMVAAIGHRIKSGASTIGANKFAMLCRQLEQFKHDGDLNQVEEIIIQMRWMLSTIERQLNEIQ